MNNDFDEAINFVLEMEGGYTLDPNDPGGETNYGISRKSYPNLDIKNLSRQDAVEIYRKDFWTPCHCDDLPRYWAMLVFDSAVNQGTRVAIRIMQIALNVTVDGIVGPKTLAAARSAKPRAVKVALAQRIAAYHRLMAEKPNLERYAVDWAFRVIDLATRIHI